MGWSLAGPKKVRPALGGREGGGIYIAALREVLLMDSQSGPCRALCSTM